MNTHEHKHTLHATVKKQKAWTGSAIPFRKITLNQNFMMGMTFGIMVAFWELVTRVTSPTVCRWYLSSRTLSLPGPPLVQAGAGRWRFFWIVRADNSAYTLSTIHKWQTSTSMQHRHDDPHSNLSTMNDNQTKCTYVLKTIMYTCTAKLFS